jgi:hypothetical protein
MKQQNQSTITPNVQVPSVGDAVSPVNFMNHTPYVHPHREPEFFVEIGGIKYHHYGMDENLLLPDEFIKDPDFDYMYENAAEESILRRKQEGWVVVDESDHNVQKTGASYLLRQKTGATGLTNISPAGLALPVVQAILMKIPRKLQEMIFRKKEAQKSTRINANRDNVMVDSDNKGVTGVTIEGSLKLNV